MNCSLPGSSVHEISQARLLEWNTISVSREIFPAQGLNLHLLYYRWILHYGANVEAHNRSLATIIALYGASLVAQM